MTVAVPEARPVMTADRPFCSSEITVGLLTAHERLSGVPAGSTVATSVSCAPAAIMSLEGLMWTSDIEAASAIVGLPTNTTASAETSPNVACSFAVPADCGVSTAVFPAYSTVKMLSSVVDHTTGPSNTLPSVARMTADTSDLPLSCER